jgi:ABC-type multidrug transport system fused ATPase/permease subunit
VDGEARLIATENILVKNRFGSTLELISPRYKQQGIYIVFLLIVSSLLDLFSLASFIPLILLVLNPEQATSHTITKRIHNLTGIDDPASVGVLLTIAVLLLIVLKAQFNRWVTFKKASYAYNMASDLASSALARYFAIPYTRFSETDYSHEVNRIANIPLTFANNFVIPAGTILAEACIAFVLLITIAIYNIYLFLFLFVMVAPIGLLYLFQRRKLRAISKDLKETYPRILKNTLQSIEGLAEIRAFRKESFFKDRFRESYQKLAKTFSRDHTASVSAMRITELIAALCIGALIIYTLLTRQTYQQTIVLITIYAGASFRAIPSVNRIFAASLQMRTHEYVIHELKDMLAVDESIATMNGTPVVFKERIDICNVSFGHSVDHLILKNASFTILKGEKIALTGKSGSGKTTLLLLLMRYLQEGSGDIKVDGIKIEKRDAMGFRNLMGYVPQNPYILDASIEENIAFGIPAHEIQTEKIKNLIIDLDLKSWIDSLPLKASTRIGEKGTKISGGQRQRLAIARALYHDAEVLLLDEITNQLDRQTEEEVLNVLNSLALRNKTILFITHKPSTLLSFDSIYEMKDGTLANIALPSNAYAD